MAARAYDRPDQVLEPGAEREEVEQRLEEAGEDDEPAAPVHLERPLEHDVSPPGVDTRRQDAQHGAGGVVAKVGGRGHRASRQAKRRRARTTPTTSHTAR